MKKILIFLSIILTLHGCTPPSTPNNPHTTTKSPQPTQKQPITLNQAPQELQTLKSTTININSTDITLFVASTESERQQGLMFQTNLPTNQGMIFVFPETQILSFWMKNTLIPLDLIFLNQDFQITDIKTDFQPCGNIDPNTTTCPTYTSPFPAKYVIELNAGSSQKLNLQPNDTLPLQLPSTN